jgi:hypothetical protein
MATQCNSEPESAYAGKRRRKRALGFRLFLATTPKTGRQKKAHARTVAIVQKPEFFDAQERAQLTRLQKKKLRLKKGRALRKNVQQSNKNVDNVNS